MKLCRVCGTKFKGTTVNTTLKKLTKYKYIDTCKDCILKAEPDLAERARFGIKMKKEAIIEDLSNSVVLDARTFSSIYFRVKGKESKDYQVSISCGKWWCDCYDWAINKNAECKHIKACKLFLEKQKGEKK